MPKRVGPLVYTSYLLEVYTEPTTNHFEPWYNIYDAPCFFFFMESFLVINIDILANFVQFWVCEGYTTSGHGIFYNILIVKGYL